MGVSRSGDCQAGGVAKKEILTSRPSAAPQNDRTSGFISHNRILRSTHNDRTAEIIAHRFLAALEMTWCCHFEEPQATWESRRTNCHFEEEVTLRPCESRGRKHDWRLGLVDPRERFSRRTFRPPQNDRTSGFIFHNQILRYAQNDRIEEIVYKAPPHFFVKRH